MVIIVFEVDELAIAYAMQRRKLKDFGFDQLHWNRLFSGVVDAGDEPVLNRIKKNLENERRQAEELKGNVERKWRQQERQVLAWLKSITKVDFKTPTVRVCIVPVVAGLTPFRDIALMIVGELRKGWGYPETIAHELAHILFNQNFNFNAETEHPYVQLIEEEIAVRLGIRKGYFDYEIPAFATWVHRAKQKEKAWEYYLHHVQDYKDISEFITKNNSMSTS